MASGSLTGAVWSLILATAGYIGLCEAGVGLATVTRVASIELDGTAALSRLVSSAWALAWLTASAAIAVGAVLALCFPLLYSVPSNRVADVRIAFVIVAFGLAVGFLSTVFSGFLWGSGRAHAHFVLFAISAIVAAATQVGIVVAGGGLVALAIPQVVGAITAVGLFRRASRRASPNLEVRLADADRGDIRRLLEPRLA